MLLDDIINILADEKGSLNAALLKTKVLLHSIGKKDLATWVTNELKGYPDDKNLPEYRICSAEVHAQIMSGFMIYKDYQLPILHLDADHRKDLTTSPCTMSIESIEEAVRHFRSNGTKLARPLPAEFGGLFRKVLTPRTNVISAWCEVNMINERLVFQNAYLARA
jgi:hypothetical protein